MTRLIAVRRCWLAVLLGAMLGGCCGSKPAATTRPILNKGDDDEPPAAAAPTPAAEAVASTAVPTAPPESSSPSGPPRRKTLEELREASAANLRDIAAAISEYVSANGVLPSYGDKLSWRVELLPYLGHDALYRQFHHNEPWNSEHNSTLIDAMPDVFRVPADEGGISGYEFFGGPGTICPNTQGLFPREVLDGLGKTLLLVQIDKTERRSSWTEPTAVTLLSARQKLKGKSEADPMFVAMWADGRVAAIDRALLFSNDFAAAVTPAGNESFNLDVGTQILGGSLIHFTPPPQLVNSVAEDSETPATPTDSEIAPPISKEAKETAAERELRLPAPDQAQQRQAMEVVRELFLDRYQKAGSLRDRQQIAAEIFDKSQSMGGDNAGEYVMLQTAIKVALESNDTQTASKAVDRLVDRFETDAYEMKVSILRKSEKASIPSAFDTTILEDAQKLMQQAIARDDYEVAKEMADVGLAAARRIGDREAANQLLRAKQQLDRTFAAYKGVQTALASVSDPTSDAQISEQAGRFYCFFKGEWDRGLPYLARCADPKLRGLSQSDLEVPLDHQKQLALADGWLEVAGKLRSPESEFVRRRSLHWYETALASLPEGLHRLKAELRVKQLKAELQQ